MKPQKQNFPFTAITGQTTFKLALTLLAINPAIGGVLVSGPRGSAKSTLAKGLADVMPSVDTDTDTDTDTDADAGATGSESTDAETRPAFVTLPLSVTEEMVVGTLDLQQVLNSQQAEFKEGLLGRANKGVLYVDEVNLLQDHIVDLLLDVAASGVNVVERDGISHSHEAQFVLLGTMNPDEGELRPQLRDRFGLSVELGNDYTIAERIEIVQRQEAFEANSETLLRTFQEQQDELKSRINTSRVRLPHIKCELGLQELIATKCHDAEVEGLRADIVWYRAALAHAAFSNRAEVTEDDINAVEELVLNHRRNKKTNSSEPPTNHKSSESKQDQLQKPFSRPIESKTSRADGSSEKADGSSDQAEGSSENAEGSQEQAKDSSEKAKGSSERADGDWGVMEPQQQKMADLIDVDLSVITERTGSVKKHAFKTVDNQKSIISQGRRPPNQAKASSQRTIAGRRLSSNQSESKSVNWFSSILANAGQWPLRKLHLNKRQKAQAVLNLVLIDTSASTLKNDLFSQAKVVILKVAKQAYVKREQLSIIGFGNQHVETLLLRQRAPKELIAFLDNLPAAGGTPFREALEHAEKIQQQQYKQSPSLTIKTIIITDGKTRQSFAHVNLIGEVVLIDIEKSSVRRGKGRKIASDLNATYMPLFN